MVVGRAIASARPAWLQRRRGTGDVAESRPMLSLLRNARLFTPEPRGVVDLAVGVDRVVHVGEDLESPPSWAADAEVDLGGRTVIPALVDCHVHVTGGGGETGPGSRIAPLSAQSYRAAGTGTVVGLLGTDDTTRTPGSLVAWCRELSAQGLTACCFTGGYHVPPTTLTGSVRADIAYVDPIIGVGEIAISDHRSSHPTTAELLRIAADAHVAGLMTGKAGVLHLHLGDGAGGLEPVRACLREGEIPPRVFHPSHVNRHTELFDEALGLARAGVTVDITAFPVDADEDAYDAPEALRRFLDSDAPTNQVTVSSDGGGCLPTFAADGTPMHFDVARPDALLGALRATVSRGTPLEDALPAFTRNPATLLRLTRRGHLAPGSAADLLVLDERHSLLAAMFQGNWFVASGEPTDTPDLGERGDG